MKAAATWSRPPWELFGGAPVVWMMRFDTLRTMEIEVVDMDADRRQREAALSTLE